MNLVILLLMPFIALMFRSLILHASTAGAIRAGRAFVELFSDDSKLTRGLKAAEQKVKGWGRALMTAGASAIAAGLALEAPIIASIKHFADAGSELNDMAARTGMSVEALSELKYAAGQTGASIEEVEVAIRHMAKTIAEATMGSDSAEESLGKLGLKLEDLQGLSPEKQFRLVSQAIDEIADPTVRAGLAMDMFGRTGTRMLPMIADFEKLTARARDLGIVMSTEDAKAADELGDVLDDLWTVIRMVSFQVGRALTPELTDLVKWLAESASLVIDFVKKNKQFVIIIAEVGLALIALGAAFTVGTVGVMIIGELIEGILALFAGIAFLIAVLPILAPLLAGLVVWAAGAGMILLAAHYFGILDLVILSLRLTVEKFLAAFSGVGVAVSNTVSGILAALSSGDLELAMQIAVKGIRLAWLEGLKTMITDYRQFTKGIFEGLKQIRIEFVRHSTAMAVVGNALFGGNDPAFTKIVTDLGKKQIDAIRKERFDKFGRGILDEIPGAQKELQDALTQAEWQRNFQNLIPGVAGPGGIPELPDPGAIGEASRKLDVAGQFGGAGLGMMGFGNTLNEDMAKAAKETAKNTARTNQILERGRKVST